MLGPPSTDLYALAFWVSLEPMLVLTAEGRIQDLNPAAARLLAMPLKETRGARVSEALQPSPELAALLAEATEARLPAELPPEAALRLGGDRVLAGAGSVSPLPSPGLLLLLLRDATEERRAEADARARVASLQDAIEEINLVLQRERQFSRLVIDTNPNMVFVKDAESRTQLANKAYYDMHETTPERVIGKKTVEIIRSAEEAALVDSDDRRVLASGRPYSRTHAITRPNGEQRWMITTKVPFVHEGEPRVFVSCLDITERKAHEDLLQQTVQELERQKQDIAAQLEVIQRQQALIQVLSTPILQVAEGVLAVPLVGTLDDARAANVTEKLLQEVSRTRARFALIDVTAVELVDAAMAERFVRMVRAIQLLGAQGIITGIQPAVARSLCDIGVDLGGITTKQNLRAALEGCLASLRSARATRG